MDRECVDQSVIRMAIEREKYEAMMSRATRLMDVHHYDKALKEIIALIALAPDDALVYQKLGYCHFKMGKYIESRDAFKTSLSLDPQNVVAHNLIAYVYMMMYQYKACLDHFNKAIEIEPGNVHSFVGIASMYEQINDWENALAYANKALAIDPNRTSGLNTRSKALSELGRIEESDEAIKQSLSRQPEESNTQATYGWTLLRAGRTDESYVAFENALRINPTNEYAQEGFVEAIKTKNWFLRKMVLFEIWIASWSASSTNTFIGALLTLLVFPPMIFFRDEEYASGVLAYQYILMILIISRYIVNPITNLFLLLNREGRRAMNSLQTKVAYAAGVSLVMTLVGMEMSFHSGRYLWLLVALYGLCMLFALGAYFKNDYPPTRRTRLNMLLLFICSGAAALMFGFFEMGIAGIFITVPICVILLTVWESGKVEDEITSSKH